MDESVIPVVAILMPLAIVALVVRVKHKARLRHYEHLERIKALEVGISPYTGGRVSGVWPALVALGLGTVMPPGVFLTAWLADMTGHAGEEVYLAAAVVGGLGVVGGTRMGSRLLDRVAVGRPARRAEEAGRGGQAKPAFDAEVYDGLALRG